MPFFGKRAKRLGQEVQPLRLDRELPGPRSKHGPFDADPVPQVEKPVQLETRLADDVLLHVELDFRIAVPEIGERRFPRASERPDPARDRDLLGVRLEELGVARGVTFDDVGDRSVRREEIRVRAVAERDDRREVRLAVADQLVFVARRDL